MNGWVAAVPETAFTELLPLLRRTFSTFEAPERRQLGQRVANGGAQSLVHTQQVHDLDQQRAELVLPILRLLLAPVDMPSMKEPQA